MAGALRPRARPATAGLGILVAVGLVALAVLGVHELAVDRGWASGSSWVKSVLDALDGRTADTATAVLGAAVAVLGLLVLLVALRPGRATHVPTTGEPDVWLSRGAVAALAAATADRQVGVVEAGAEVSRRRITLRVVARTDRDGVETRVREALANDALTAQRVDLTVDLVGSAS